MATNAPGGRFTSQWAISDALAQVLAQIQGEHTEFVAQREQVRNLRVRFCTEVLRRLDEDAPTGANERG